MTFLLRCLGFRFTRTKDILRVTAPRWAVWLHPNLWRNVKKRFADNPEITQIEFSKHCILIRRKTNAV